MSQHPRSVLPPAANPCGSCPYRKDVPSGIWHPAEYAKLPAYDAETPFQPPGLFLCHQQDGRVCAGWAGTHDMNHCLAVRFAMCDGRLSARGREELLNYKTAVPLFESGQAAAEHGLHDVKRPRAKARQTIDNLTRKRQARK